MTIPLPEPDSAAESRHLPLRRGAFLIGGLGLAVLGALLFATTRGDEQPSPVAVGHIHGIWVDPDDGQLYVGARLGVFRVARTERWRRSVRSATTRWRSPWPGPATSSRPVTRRSAPTSPSTWGLDSARGLLLTSTDNCGWETVAQGRFIDVAADPADTDSTLATTGSGELRSYDTTSSSTSLSQAPMLTFIDCPVAEQLVGLAPDGFAFVSATTGSSWGLVGQVPGQPTALEVTESQWYAASDPGLFSSVDAGSSWQPPFTYGDPS